MIEWYIVCTFCGLVLGVLIGIIIRAVTFEPVIQLKELTKEKSILVLVETTDESRKWVRISTKPSEIEKAEVLNAEKKSD